jgi:hypothetical protein
LLYDLSSIFGHSNIYVILGAITVNDKVQHVGLFDMVPGEIPESSELLGGIELQFNLYHVGANIQEQRCLAWICGGFSLFQSF